MMVLDKPGRVNGQLLVFVRRDPGPVGQIGFDVGAEFEDVGGPVGVDDGRDAVGADDLFERVEHGRGSDICQRCLFDGRSG